ncbi:MAG TPA: hypothetical protein DDW76_07665 [Cyanobacteria bacterium UBA11369]|nr:hypothetical protein [Cyanobacteria bacterium UBA11371]HBE48658.1 hypothetical protein [Cyanobacteria bacterium UBA11369]
MEITWNRDTQTLEIHVHADQVSDELLGVLPGATRTAEGCLAWSIRFGDVTRAPRSSNTVQDELLGVTETLVGDTFSTASRTPSSEPVSVIRGTLILTFNNLPITEALTSLGGRQIPIFADNIAPRSSSSVSSSNINPFSDTFGILPNPTEMPVLLFANPFSG